MTTDVCTDRRVFHGLALTAIVWISAVACSAVGDDGPVQSTAAGGSQHSTLPTEDPVSGDGADDDDIGFRDQTGDRGDGEEGDDLGLTDLTADCRQPTADSRQPIADCQEVDVPPEDPVPDIPPCPEHEERLGDTCVCNVGWLRIATDCVPAGAGAGALGTDWHPDPDGDGLVGDTDNCPYVYDPDHVDTDDDGVGDVCDPDGLTLTPDGAIGDLRIEHVTPYGAWLTFTSTRISDPYQWDGTLLWTTEATELASAEGWDAIVARGNGLGLRFDETYGHEISKPIILIELDPATDYHAALVRRAMSSWREPSNAVAFRTADAPAIELPAAHPRVMVSTTTLTDLRQRAADVDTMWWAWADAIGSRAILKANTPDDILFGSSRYCPFAALLYLVTDDTSFRDAARSLFDIALSEWEGNQFGDNQYRWSSARLGQCLDLLWNDLTEAQRDRAVRAMLEDDERVIGSDLEQEEDTDEYTSKTRSWLIDGLVGCDAEGIDAELSQRLCAVLDRGLRRWFGMQLVQTRRDRGFLAFSGGYPSDGSFYGASTLSYWYESMWVLHNAGVTVRNVAPWIRNSFISYNVQSRTPSGLGVYTVGDVESYANSAEPNSYQMTLHNDEQLGWQMGLLATAGDEASGWVRYALDRWTAVRGHGSISTLLFADSSIPAIAPSTVLPTAHLASGLGVFVDRTSWHEGASMLVFTAGWRGVDHRHADVGHFQLYRAGQWVTHEVLGYVGVAASAGGHSTLLLEVRDSAGGTEEVGAYQYGTPNTSRIVRASSGPAHAFVSADMAGVYQSHIEKRYDYERVTRQLLWLKSDEADRPDTIVLLDEISLAEGAPTTLRRAQRFHLDNSAVVDGRVARSELSGGRSVVVASILPASTTFELADPVPGAEPGVYPGGYYTYRLDVLDGSEERDSSLLTVFQVGDSAALAVDSMPVLQTDRVTGVTVGQDTVAFVSQDGPGETLTIDLQEEVDRIWLVGMEPEGHYQVVTEPLDEGLRLTITLGGTIEADLGGVLALVIRDGIAVGL